MPKDHNPKPTSVNFPNPSDVVFDGQNMSDEDIEMVRVCYHVLRGQVLNDRELKSRFFFIMAASRYDGVGISRVIDELRGIIEG